MKEELCTVQSANSVKHEPKMTATVTAESLHSNCFAVNRYCTIDCWHKHFKIFFFLGIEYRISGSQSGVYEDYKSTGLGRLVCRYILHRYFEGSSLLNLQHIIFERKIFRRIYGPKCENVKSDESRTRKISKGENIVKWIKGLRISWLGHPEGREEDRMPKKIFTQELEGTRRRGRPRKRWKEEAERDLQVLGVRRLRELVADRKKWKDIFDRPKPTVGCSAKGRRRRRRRIFSIFQESTCYTV